MNILNMLPLFLFLVLIASAFVVVKYLLVKLVKPVDKWILRVNDPKLLDACDDIVYEIAGKKVLESEDYSLIFKYFLTGVSHYRSASFARIVYPGVSGTRGEVVEGLEGFARTAPLLAVWLSSGRENEVTLLDKRVFTVSEHLKIGIASGVDPSHPEYWGDFEDYDQRIVEAADIAISIFLLKGSGCYELTELQEQYLVRWFSQALKKKIYGGNWLLFQIVINLVMKSITGKVDEDLLATQYTQFKSFYIGDGWFCDGSQGAVDYYNAWQMHYMLYWIRELEPSLDSEFIKTASLNFSNGFQYFISNKGFPVFGRSCCYRLAIPSPLIVSSLYDPRHWCGRAKRSLDVTWTYFVGKGALKQGRVTQGYYEDDVDLLENYSGRASPMWSLRSLVLAFVHDEKSDFWCSEGRLPIELGSFNVNIEAPGFKLEGKGDTGEIELTLETPFQRVDSIKQLTFKRMNPIAKLLQYLLKRPLRVSNMGAKYGRRRYTNSMSFFERS